ncbi:DNA polymerase III subunit chi [Novosphingobium guangzhouense]|uniref:DNA polymerase III subunit chi n=1 Tax=Novosphingobium guangzhouense TaxID=1850347 RepID=A0A2K2G261_9SPHN|nr:DNA polymerase III subunit chi [Novosphingobium guangzhouense]PNU05114.1 DNA polymerase III subunit chi [Novosphingobium guangzhouense]
MQVMFYELSRDPAHAVVPLLARRIVEMDGRVLVVSADDQQRGRISAALWAHRPDGFLANGQMGEGDEERQPILLSDIPDPLNGARFLVIADGVWCEGEEPFERTFYLFDDETRVQARQVWRDLRGREGVKKEYWAQEDGRWAKKAEE